MLIEFKKWKEVWLSYKVDERDEVDIIKNPSMGMDIDFITGSIKLNYFDNNLTICQNANKVDYSNAVLTPVEYYYEFLSKSEINISISQRDFFDSIFSSNSIKTGNKFFDKKYIIKGSEKKLILLIFKEAQIQKFFTDHPLLLFNVNSNNGVTTIKMKNMVKKLYSREELLSFLELFKIIISKIVKYTSN